MSSQSHFLNNDDWFTLGLNTDTLLVKILFSCGKIKFFFKYNITTCKPIVKAGNTAEKVKLSTIDLLIKVTCFVKEVNNIFNKKAADLK